MAEKTDEDKPTAVNIENTPKDDEQTKPPTSSSPEATARPSWNHYLGTYSNIFPDELDVIKSDLTDADALSTELGEILGVADNLKLVYKNFVDHMNKDGERSFPGDNKEVDRETIFKNKLLNVLRDNVEYFCGRRSWQSGATCFADWTEEECKRRC